VSTYVLQIGSEFADDAEAAARWYEAQQPGLGKAFTDSVELALEGILHDPLLLPLVYKHYHRKIVRRFPYMVLYKVEVATIYVVACMHMRRNPRSWRKRLV
jgi:hypothetical protein